MTKTKIVAATAAVLLFLFAGCSAKSGASRQRSSMLTVAAVPGGAFALSDSVLIAVTGGSLDLHAALLSVERVEIEENTGEGPGQNGGEQGENDEGEGEGEGEESDLEDIVLAGPFSFDIAAGGAVLDSVSVFPGTFRKVDLTFHRAAGAPFDDHSIHLAGQFLPSSGPAIPITLRSRSSATIQVPIANGGVTVGGNSMIPIAIAFDLAGMLTSLDFANAVVESGEILIDETHNAQLLAAFEANLQTSVEAEEHDR